MSEPMKVTDPTFVRRILDEMDGEPNQLKADRVARELGKRIRSRARERVVASASSEQAKKKLNGSSKFANDPLLSAMGTGKDIWGGQDAVEYVRSLRMGWEDRDL